MVLTYEGSQVNKASFNQASFQMIRINELFLIIDRLSCEPLGFINGTSSHKIIFNTLNTVLGAISSKLTPTELKEVINKKKEISVYLVSNPVYRMRDVGIFSTPTNFFNPSNGDKLNDLLFDYRVLIEHYMDKHGLGNPNKENASISVGQM